MLILSANKVINDDTALSFKLPSLGSGYLGSVKKVASLNIKWNAGATRQYHFKEENSQ